MKETEQKLVFNSLLKQYIYFGLSTEGIDDKTDFTIHNIRFTEAKKNLVK